MASVTWGFLSILSPLESEFEEPIRPSAAPLGYMRPKCMVPFRYLKILFTVIKCDPLGFA